MTFKVIKVSQWTNRIYEEGIWNNFYINRATLEPSVRFSQRELVNKPEEPVNKRDDRINEGGGKITTEKIGDEPCNSEVGRIVRHAGEKNIVRYVVR